MSNRKQRQAIAKSTLEVLNTGKLGELDISEAIRTSVDGTQSYRPDEVCPKLLSIAKTGTNVTTHFDAINTTTLKAAKDLLEEQTDVPVAVLNFASAKNPGGGFLGGSLAQEESLASHSTLYQCLKNDPMYEFHRPMKGGIYSDWCIYSPNVLVFREETNDSCHPLIQKEEDLWYMNVITCPCLNQGTAKLPQEELLQQLEKRMRRMLSVLAAHHVGNVVLGAWGCGVFRNDPNTVAKLFAKLLCSEDSPFKNRWPKVVFAVLDKRPPHNTIKPFCRIFGSSTSSKWQNQLPRNDWEETEQLTEGS